jgi:hypothetical protein
LLVSVAPIPWQQLIEPLDRMLGDAVQNVGEPGLWIDVVHFGRDDEAGRWSLAAAAALQRCSVAALQR